MGNLVFQATLGGQVNLVGPNTASTFNLNVPAVSSTIATTSGTETLTNKTLTSPVISGGTIDNAVIGGTTAAAGSFTTITTSSTINNLTVGRGAGAVSTNTAVGASALANNTTGNQGVFVGSGAGSSNTTGANNVAIGFRSLYSGTTTGGQNAGVGSYALYGLTTGAYNSGLGQEVLQSNTTGSYNVAVGGNALNSNTTASNNTAVGYQAGYANTTGQYNVFVGRNAGLSATTAQGNVFIGDSAGGLVTTGYANTFIGPNWSAGGASGGSVTTGYKNTIIGAYTGNQNGLDIRTANNYIVLSDGDGNPRGVFDSSGTLLINATSKVSGTTYLSVQGAAGSSNIFEQKDTGTSYASGNYYQVYWNSSNSVAGGIAHTAATTVAFSTSSDVRLKENIVDAPSVLDKVLASRVRSFDWKEDKHHVEYGFIAQELYEHLPEVIGKGDDTETIENPNGTWQVEYGRLTPMLVKAIQEQQAIIIQLQADVAALKGQA